MMVLVALFILGGILMVIWGLSQPIMYAGTYWTVGLLCFAVAGLISISEHLHVIKNELSNLGRQAEPEEPEKPEGPEEPKKPKKFFSMK
ncbi:MAG: hypothetical protein IIA17_04255 [candidate division Zixibacteria bacterium]|nr:hypothetical protein [candidate division Zixibacteria bacterium]